MFLNFIETLLLVTQCHVKYLETKLQKKDTPLNFSVLKFLSREVRKKISRVIPEPILE